MSDHPAEPGEGADDLLGRWLAHHDKPSGDDGETPRPRRVPSAARPSEAATPVSRPSAASALADLKAKTVDRHDGLGPVTPPSSFGVKRGLPGTAHSGPGGEPDRNYDRGVAELDRESPLGFEPIIIGSVRKKKEQPEPDKDRVGRLKRLRSKVSTHDEGEVVGDPVVVEEPTSFVPPPVFKTTQPGSIPPPPVFPTKPEPSVEGTVEAKVEAKAEAKVDEPAKLSKPKQKRKIVAYEDMIALATLAALPATEPEVEAEPEPVVVAEPDAVTNSDDVVEPVQEAEPVLPGSELDTPPSPHPVLPEHQDDEVPPMAAVVASPTPPTTKRRLVARPKTDETKRRPPAARKSEPSTDTADAARGMLAAARAATPETRTPRVSPVRTARVIETVPMIPAATAVDLAVPIAPSMEMPPVYEFAPLKGPRRLMSVLLAGGLVASAYLGYGAYLSRETVEIGIAGVVTLATLIIWGVRAGSSVTRLTVRSGQLEIVRQGGRQVFDLTSHYTPIEIVGKTGSKKWKVLFLRRGMAPAIVDSSMVDSKEFMKILGFFRPELVSAR